MTKQNYEIKNDRIREKFAKFRRDNPESIKRRLNLSWSNWGFGMENLVHSAKRLADAGIVYIELHGNHYGDDLGYDEKETLNVLEDHGLKVSGICGMFSAGNDLSSKIIARQNSRLQETAIADFEWHEA